MTQGKKAIVLLSGGLDSSTLLALAIDQGYDCYTISFDYGQRHNAELTASTNIAELFGVNEHRVIKLGLSEFGGSALTDNSISVPESRTEGIPITYVPARNTIFLSYALAWSEVIKAYHIFIGVNAVDYSGYPDCRPEYINAFQEMAKLATKAGVEGQTVEIHTPLINLSKTDIIRTGTRLGVDYSQTVSCYQADHEGRACGKCDSCFYRKEGFREAGIPDPTIYRD
jgi:7-cyano-7-deazaguanine synthase